MDSRPRRVAWTPRARDALDEVLSFIAAESPSGASRVLDLALGTAASLEQLAARGRVVPELRDNSIREVFVFSYRLIYRLSDKQVDIIAFLHGARDFGRWAESLDQ